jgi:hypothetical protein
VLQQCPQSINVSSILTKFEQEGFFLKKRKKQRNEQPWTLVYTLILQTMSCPFKCYFWFGPIDFPSKMMSCRLNHNLIRFGLGPLSKCLGTNLKLSTNKNVWVHWTLLLGPLSKMVLNISPIFQKDQVLWSSLTLCNVWSHPKVITCYIMIFVQVLLPWQKL